MRNFENWDKIKVSNKEYYLRVKIKNSKNIGISIEIYIFDIKNNTFIKWEDFDDEFMKYFKKT